MPDARATLIGTAIVIFVFRSVPEPGPGINWWQIDVLGFDQHFMAVLSLIGSSLALAGIVVFRRLMVDRSITYVLGFLTLSAFVLGLPILGIFYGLHGQTATMTGGIIDARFIILVDTALKSPLSQIAMIPILTWIANSAPSNLKATYFAVMTSFTNLAIALSQLGTKYLNNIYVVTREVRDHVTGVVVKAADYSQLDNLFVMQLVLALVVPFLTIFFARITRFRSS
jgi:hypothetical protein